MQGRGDAPEREKVDQVAGRLLAVLAEAEQVCAVRHQQDVTLLPRSGTSLARQSRRRVRARRCVERLFARSGHTVS